MPASIAFQRPNLKRRNEDSHGKREGISLEGEGVRVKGATSDLKYSYRSLPWPTALPPKSCLRNMHQSSFLPWPFTTEQYATHDSFDRNVKVLAWWRSCLRGIPGTCYPTYTDDIGLIHKHPIITSAMHTSTQDLCSTFPERIEGSTATRTQSKNVLDLVIGLTQMITKLQDTAGSLRSAINGGSTLTGVFTCISEIWSELTMLNRWREVCHRKPAVIPQA